jgi:hypothetical protein
MLNHLLLFVQASLPTKLYDSYLEFTLQALFHPGSSFTHQHSDCKFVQCPNSACKAVRNGSVWEWMCVIHGGWRFWSQVIEVIAEQPTAAAKSSIRSPKPVKRATCPSQADRDTIGGRESVLSRMKAKLTSWFHKRRQKIRDSGEAGAFLSPRTVTPCFTAVVCCGYC